MHLFQSFENALCDAKVKLQVRLLTGKCREQFLEVTQVAVLSDQHKRVFAVCHSEEGVEIVHNVGAFESFELVRFLYCFFESCLIHVYFGN